MRSLLVVSAIIFSCFGSVGAFGLTFTRRLQTAPDALPTECIGTYTRKQYVEQTALVISSVFAVANPALAKDSLEEDKQKLVAGYKRLNYLVDNWEKEVGFVLGLVGLHSDIFLYYSSIIRWIFLLGFFLKDNKLQNQDRVLIGQHSL
jgi:hypothetical protein